MAYITTLIEDIYALLESGDFKVSDDVLSKSFDGNDNKRKLRLSNVGSPSCRLWYELTAKVEGEKLPAPAIFKFMYGHVIEELVLDLAVAAGHTVEHRQKSVSVDGVPGHIDGYIDGVLIDVKSCSTFAYKKFIEHKLLEDDAFGYLYQLNSYMTAEKQDMGGFLAIDKTLGNMCIDLYDQSELEPKHNIPAQINKQREALKSKTRPPRCFEPKKDGVSKKNPEGNGNLILDVTCSYCPYKFPCWADANGGEGLKEFKYSQKPKFMTHMAKKPKVEEVLNG